MVSRNNYKLRREKSANKNVQHWSLRKLSFGVASVLLGTTLYFGTGQVAHADTVSTGEQPQTQEVTSSGAQQSASAVALKTSVASAVANSSAVSSAPNSIANSDAASQVSNSSVSVASSMQSSVVPVSSVAKLNQVSNNETNVSSSLVQSSSVNKASNVSNQVVLRTTPASSAASQTLNVGSLTQSGNVNSAALGVELDQAPASNQVTDMHRASRTIVVINPEGSATTTVQNATQTRTGTKDSSGNITWGNWSDASWPQFQIPKIKGYEPYDTGGSNIVEGNYQDGYYLDAYKLHGGEGNISVTIGYRILRQNVKVNLVDIDSNNDIVGEQSTDGNYGDTININLGVPDGYQLVAGETIPKTETVSDQPTVVNVKVQHVKYTTDTPMPAGSRIPGAGSREVVSGLSENDLNWTVSRKIIVNEPGGTVVHHDDVTVFHRSGTVDAVTAAVTYSPWTVKSGSTSWSAYSLPRFDGYAPDHADFPAVTDVTPDFGSESYTVNYHAVQEYDQTISYVDVDADGYDPSDPGANGEVGEDTISGYNGESVAFPAEPSLDPGYILGSHPASYVIKNNGEDPIYVPVHEKIVHVSHTAPVADGTTVPNTDDEYTYDGLSDADLNKDIQRTIIVKKPDGTTQTIKQDGKVYRDGQMNLITGETTYSAWTNGQWNQYQAPSFKGYIPSQATVSQQTVISTMQPVTVTITYSKNSPATVTQNKDVTETIKYVYAGTGNIAAPTKTVTLHFTRTGSKDPVTDKVSWNAWTPQSFAAVVSPTITGYKPDKATIAAVDNVTGDSADLNCVVTYTQAHQISVVYRDISDSSNWKTLLMRTFNVIDGEDTGYKTQSDIANLVSQHYVLTMDTTGGDEIVGGKTGSVYYVDFKHATQPVSKVVDVVRTIHYKYADGTQAQPDKVQTDKFTISGTKDLVTNKESWKPVASQSFDEVVTPSLKGYTPDKTSIAKVDVVTPETKDSEVTVVYTKDGLSQVTDTKVVKQTIHFEFADGTQAKPDDVQTLAFTRIGEKDLVTGDIQWGSWSGQQKFNDVISPAIKGYTPSVAKVVGQSVEYNSQNVEKTIVYHKNASVPQHETKTVVRHIAYEFNNGSQAASPVTQQLKFQRDGEQDPVTGNITWGAWTPEHQTFSNVTSPVIHGYTADKLVVNSQQVDANVNDINVVIKYTKNAPSQVTDSRVIKQVLHYEFPDGTQAAPDSVQTLTFQRVGKKDAVTGNVVWGDWTKAQKFNDVVSPSIKGYTPDIAKVTGQQVDYNSKDVEKTIVYHKDASKQVTQSKSITETIKYEFADGTQAAPTYTKTLNFERHGSQDPVTDKISWDSWTPQSFDAVTSPVIHGYTPSRAKVDAINDVTGDSKNVEITITYKRNVNIPVHEVNIVKETIQYEFENGTQAAPDNVQTLKFEKSGYRDPVTNQITWTSISPTQGFHKVTSPTITGYAPDKDYIPAVLNVPDTAKDIIVVVTYHKLANVPVTDTKTVKQTIHYVDSQGNMVAPDNVQTLTFTRQGSKDSVTGAISWGSWAPAHQTFSDVTSPVLDGYTADIKVVKGAQVDNNSADILKTVTYSKKAPVSNVVTESRTISQTVHYKYASDNSQAAPDNVQTIVFTRTGIKDNAGHVTWNPWTPASRTFNNVTSPVIDGFDPSQATVNGASVDPDSKDVVVTVTYTKHRNPATPVNQSKQVTRTIEVTDPVTGVTKTTKQVVTLTRNGQKDADGNITWDSWSQGQWNQFVPATIVGYTPSTKLVPQVTVDGNTKDVTIEISYVANKQTAKVVYEDVNNNDKVVKTQVLNGRTGQTVDIQISAPEGYQLVPGQNLPTKYIFLGAGNKNVVVYVEETGQQPTTPVQPTNPNQPTGNPGQNTGQPTNPNQSQPTNPGQNIGQPTQPSGQTPTSPVQPTTVPSQPTNNSSQPTQPSQSTGQPTTAQPTQVSNQPTQPSQVTTPSQQPSGQNPTQPTVQPVQPSNAQPTGVQRPSEQVPGQTTVQPTLPVQQSSEVTPVANEVAQPLVTIGGQTVVPEAKLQKVTTKTQAQKSVSENANKLPQTGQNKSGLLASVAGMLMAGLTGLGIGKKRRKE